jgi:hypothetical protein
MDRIVMIAAVIAVIAIAGAALMLNQPAEKPKTTTPVTTPDEDEEPDYRPVISGPAINYTNSTYGQIPEELSGNCVLYKHVSKNEYKCFGTAGNYSTSATNEYRTAESDTYFCKPTEYGCRLYEKVYIQPF